MYGEKKKLAWASIILLCCVILGFGAELKAKDANATQFFYIVKKLFPETEEIAVFLSKQALASQKTMIDRAAMQNKLKVKVFVIETSVDVGKRIKELKDNSVLVIFESEVLMKKSTQLYVLKNCKGKKVAIFTASRDYTDLGALMGIIKNESNAVELVLNLKHNDYLKPKFSDDFIQQAGIAEVIQ